MLTDKELQECFSKSFLSISDCNVSARYVSSKDNTWATQCFSDDSNSKKVFETLLSRAEAFKISISPETGVEFDFTFNGKSEPSTVDTYYPSAHDLTKKEYEDLLENHSEESVQREIQFAELFSGVDMNDDKAALAVLSKIISERQTTDSVIDFEVVSRCTRLYENAKNFSENYEFGFADVLTSDPAEMDCVILSTAINEGRRFWNFTDEGKADFLKLVSDSMGFDIECGLSSGESILNITFYAR